MLHITIDIARGFAALWVFLFHTLDGSAPFFVQKWAAYGSLGVPLFFVISGYCITSSAHSSIKLNVSTGSFLKRRLLRIFPPFWASILVIVTIPFATTLLKSVFTGTTFYPVSEFQHLTIVDWLQIITLSRVFLNGGENLQIVFSPVSTVYWTLAIEIQFYCIMVIAVACRKFFGKFLIGVTVVSVAVYLLPIDINKGLFILYWPMFSLGILLFYMQHYNFTLITLTKNNAVKVSVSVCGIMIAISLWLIFNDLFGKFLELCFKRVTWGFAFSAALFLWCFAPIEGEMAKIRSRKIPAVASILRAGIFMGSISYSLYLLHTPIFDLLEKGTQYVLPLDTAGIILLRILFTIALCAVFSHFLERPFKSKHRK